MKNWKNTFEKTLNINAVMDKYDDITTALAKANEDLRRKNNILHELLLWVHDILPEDQRKSLEEKLENGGL